MFRVRLSSALDCVEAVRHMNPYPLARFALPFSLFPFFLWLRDVRSGSSVGLVPQLLRRWGAS